jgi:hypothetical protein
VTQAALTGLRLTQRRRSKRSKAMEREKEGRKERYTD